MKDRKPIKEMLETLNLPSVNQLAVEIKITEVWKSIHDPMHPIKMDRNKNERGKIDRVLSPGTTREMKDNARTKIGENSLCISAGKIWNQAPQTIKSATTLTQAKKLIKENCKTIPI